ncbi:undecaprenyl-diphosphate phosphatase [Patulibacter minatonensis]|uniref:undecaprenyl-diphosphate phosphatase n=1 Tax=Patulibacter minatonensis TaxID=298163 RepID=UPI00047E1BA6|nr:undecaprenyl-diphosphate phosphatase [Patulibacter minatonensis]
MTALPTPTPQLSPRRSLAAALLAGALHGPAEALPVSSSAHVAFVARLAAGRRGRRPADPEVAKSVEVGAHAGTLLGLTIGLRGEAVKATAGVLREPRLAALTGLRIVAASVPAVVGALTLERQIERHLGGDRTIAMGLVAGSAAMLVADAVAPGGAIDRRRRDPVARGTSSVGGSGTPGEAGHDAAPGEAPSAAARDASDPRVAVRDGVASGGPSDTTGRVAAAGTPHGPGRPWEDGTVVDAVLIGTAQAAALWPGISRSGAVLVAARLRGFSREASGKISAALAVPAVGGATALKVVRLGIRLRDGTIDPKHLTPLVAVTTTGALSGVVAAPMARRTLEGLPLWPFAGYRVLLAGALAAADCRWRR